MDKVNRLLEKSARYFGLDGSPPECWDDGHASPRDAEATRRRPRRSPIADEAIKDRDRTCSATLHRALMRRR